MNPDFTMNHDRLQDLVNILLDQAVTVSHALARLHTLAAAHPGTDLDAHADVRHAITNMTHARASLIQDADRLTHLIDQRHTSPYANNTSPLNASLRDPTPS